MARCFNLRRNHYDDTNAYNRQLATGPGCDGFWHFCSSLFHLVFLPQVHRREVWPGTWLSHLGPDFQCYSFDAGRRIIRMVVHPAFHSGREFNRGSLYVGKNLPRTREERLAGPHDIYSHLKFNLYSLPGVFGITTDCQVF